MRCQRRTALPWLPLLSLPPRPCDGDKCPQLSDAKRGGGGRGIRNRSGRGVPGGTCERCRGARHGDQSVPRRGARQPETARGLEALAGEQGAGAGAGALTCDAEGHCAKGCRCWRYPGGLSAWTDLLVCRSQPAGTEPGQVSRWAVGRARMARVQLGIQSELLHPCSGPRSGPRPWCWGRWAFDLLGKTPPESLIV